MKLGNNLWEHTNFNSRLQPTQIGLGTTATSSSLLGLDYSYNTTGQANNNGNVRSQTITGGGVNLVQSYGYDAVNRLTVAEEKAGGITKWSQTFTYDRYGNRTLLVNGGSDGGLLPPPFNASPIESSNRLTGLSYDKAGNVTMDNTGNSFAYDGESRQKSSTVGGVTASYHYDGDGRRVKKEAGAVVTVYVYNGAGQMVAEYSSGENYSAAGTQYVSTDHLGSTRMLSGGSGTVRGRYDYLAYGEEIGGGVSGRVYAASVFINLKFTSKERHSPVNGFAPSVMCSQFT